MDRHNDSFATKQDTMFLQENRQRLVNSIADQIYNTIVSKSAGNAGKYGYFIFKDCACITLVLKRIKVVIRLLLNKYNFIIAS